MRSLLTGVVAQLLCPSLAQPLDVVPVDLATNGILAALAASARRPGVHVYQIGTSHCNPLSASPGRRLIPPAAQSCRQRTCPRCIT